MVIQDVCPRCKSPKYKKNGHIHNGKQNHHCHDCGRQFVQGFEQYLIADDKRALIERLLLERLSLRGICRAVGVTLKWLLGFLVQCFEALPDHLHVQPVSCQHDVLIQRLEVEADELASFVQKKANKQWVWIAMGLLLDSRVVMGQCLRHSLCVQAFYEGRDRCGIAGKSHLISSAYGRSILCKTPESNKSERQLPLKT